MANSPSAIKRVRKNIKRRDRNRMVKSEIRTLQRHFESAIEQGEIDAAQSHYNVAAGALDKAASKGVVHKNLAARRKSRMAAKLKAAQ